MRRPERAVSKDEEMLAVSLKDRLDPRAVVLVLRDARYEGPHGLRRELRSLLTMRTTGWAPCTRLPCLISKES
jgi:hypothetical protein